MNRLVAAELDEKRGAVADLCAKYGVARLHIFGSGTTDEWHPTKSDLDFIVAFRRDSQRSLADRYLGLAEELENLFGRPVDLLTERSIRNPIFRRNVEATRTLLYAE